MKVIEKEVVELPIGDILPDENQPRKYFDATKIANLVGSIKKYGIMNPVTVEKVGDKYLLVDGERRYRAATEAKLKSLPAIIIAPQSKIDRLVQQFHIQEQHEGWTATEKASTVGALAEEMGVNFTEMAKLLGINRTQITRYLAFFSLLERKEFEKSEIKLEWAPYILSTVKHAEKIYEKVLEQSFDQLSKRKLEKAIIAQIRLGEIQTGSSLTKLKDSFTKDPKSIEKFSDKGISVSELFIKTKAQGAYHLRNLCANASYVSTHGSAYLSNADAIPTAQNISQLKSAKNMLEKILQKIEN